MIVFIRLTFANTGDESCSDGAYHYRRQLSKGLNLTPAPKGKIMARLHEGCAAVYTMHIETEISGAPTSSLTRVDLVLQIGAWSSQTLSV
jgi:hypothetical protein